MRIKTKKSIAVVGSGGKTSAIFSCVRQFLNQPAEKIKTKNENNLLSKYLGIEAEKSPSRILILTTTKMYIPTVEWNEYTMINRPVKEMTDILQTKHLCIAGKRIESGYPAKMGPIDERDYQILAKNADIILMEADGSKGLPLKYPASCEPVYPKDMSEVLLLAGLSALHQPLNKVCHRGHLAARSLHLSMDQKVTAEVIYHLLNDGYIKELQKHHPNCKIHCLLNQMDVVKDEEEVTNLDQKLLSAGVDQVIKGSVSQNLFSVAGIKN